MKLIIISLIVFAKAIEFDNRHGSMLELINCLRTNLNQDECYRKKHSMTVATVSRPLINKLMYGAVKPPSCDVGCRREDYWIDLEKLETTTGWAFVPTKQHPLTHKKYMNIGQCRGSCKNGIRPKATCSHVGGEALFQNKKGERFVIDGFFADYCLCAYSAQNNCDQTI